RVFCGSISAFLLSSAVAAAACETPYTVQQGDTLALIARANLGNVERYVEIYDLNREAIGADPDRILVGLRLDLPCQVPSLVKASAWNRLPDADTLAAQLPGRVQVVDIRPASKLEGGLIPGALSMPYRQWRGPAQSPGTPPSDTVLSDRIGAAGLRLDRPIVVVSSSAQPFDFGRAAYVYWVLKSVGARQIGILQGGTSAWIEAGRAVTAQPARARPYRASVTLSDAWRAQLSEVDAIARGQSKGALLDARPSSAYLRQSKAKIPLASTLPYAQNRPASFAHNTLRTAPTHQDGVLSMLDQLKSAAVSWETETVVSFCDTGELGALNWFYASEIAGIKNVKLYPESATGWKASGRALSVPGVTN
ncbi:MAG: rhodanese-like domain-containing protein, partial [Pseudomonadota bacterium]